MIYSLFKAKENLERADRIIHISLGKLIMPPMHTNTQRLDDLVTVLDKMGAKPALIDLATALGVEVPNVGSRVKR